MRLAFIQKHLAMENTSEQTSETVVATEVMLTEAERQIEILKIHNEALNLKVKRLFAEFDLIDKEADELECKDPDFFNTDQIGQVVRLRDYQRLQIASAKARAMLQVKLEALQQNLEQAWAHAQKVKQEIENS